MERDDITLVFQGVTNEIDYRLWTREFIEGSIGAVYHHKFWGFESTVHDDGTSNEQTKEKDGWYNMTFCDFCWYLDQRRLVKESKLDSSAESDDLF